MNERRLNKHAVDNCRGQLFIRGDKILCTDCPLCVQSKRKTDIAIKHATDFHKHFDIVKPIVVSINKEDEPLRKYGY